MKLGVGFAGLLVLVYVAGSILSSPIVNAKKYRDLMVPETGDFAEDIEQISYDQIPLLDKESAALLGNRKMGSMVDMVSQFEVSDLSPRSTIRAVRSVSHLWFMQAPLNG